MLLVLLALAGVLSSGCTTRVYSRGYVRYSAPVVFAQAPELVYVEPGIYVVRNYDDAIYYSDGYYWSYRGGVWYHTSHWSEPWVTVRVSSVPRAFVHRDHRAYVHYHGAAGASTYRQPARTYHTAAASAHHGSPPPAPPPAAATARASGHDREPMAHRGQGNNDRAAGHSAAGRSAPSDRSQAPSSDRQVKAAAALQPARSDADKKQPRSSDSAAARPSKKKTKRR